MFHPGAVQGQLMGPGGVQRRDQAQGASVEVSAKNSFCIFFFFFLDGQDINPRKWQVIMKMLTQPKLQSQWPCYDSAWREQRVVSR